jgi:hypothetical protein
LLIPSLSDPAHHGGEFARRLPLLGASLIAAGGSSRVIASTSAQVTINSASFSFTSLGRAS